MGGGRDRCNEGIGRPPLSDELGFAQLPKGGPSLGKSWVAEPTVCFLGRFRSGGSQKLGDCFAALSSAPPIAPPPFGLGCQWNRTPLVLAISTSPPVYQAPRRGSPAHGWGFGSVRYSGDVGRLAAHASASATAIRVERPIFLIGMRLAATSR